MVLRREGLRLYRGREGRFPRPLHRDSRRGLPDARGGQRGGVRGCGGPARQEAGRRGRGRQVAGGGVFGDVEGLKRDAAYAAVDRYVESSMTVGLGSGTTAAFVVARIGELLAGGELRNVRGIPTSERTAALAREVGIPLAALSEAYPALTIDGADEIGPGLALIKGRGGALLREKIVAAASARGLVVVADRSEEHTSELQSRQYL